ncbi:unnamed protein product [Protopolystoma xenopodis]|uniref:Uncharacterized protein n=1 Tax=Protopolystoma xenopodis TaxID=117903 RepID=A0A3S5CNJ1_9PLAT|nr:unnamed protein product [Protopolystoma xenopodis]
MIASESTLRIKEKKHFEAKKARLESSSHSGLPITTTSSATLSEPRLSAILPAVVTCSRPHLVPAWTVHLLRNPLLRWFSQTWIASQRPLDRSLKAAVISKVEDDDWVNFQSHLKRVDSITSGLPLVHVSVEPELAMAQPATSEFATGNGTPAKITEGSVCRVLIDLASIEQVIHLCTLFFH